MGLFDFLKKKPQTLEERYGKVSMEAFKTGNWTNALVELEKLEEEGLGEASIALGQYIQMSDAKKAGSHFHKASKKGIAEGSWGFAAFTGHSYRADEDVFDDIWHTYCLKAAKGGCGDAMNELGNVYNRRNNYLSAFYWYQMAAYYEHPDGYRSVEGIINKYISAGMPEISSTIDGVSNNEEKNAISIFRCLTKQDKLDQARMDSFLRAAMEDDNEIMGLFIGHFFEDVVKKDGNAKLGYQLAANNDSIIGTKCLADMFAFGKGCARDIKAAMPLYQKAADACEKTSCFVMGESLRKENPYLAAYYYAVAYRRGYEPALARLQQM